jgi:asparagine synthase (glutamine-hydrolysing)
MEGLPGDVRQPVGLTERQLEQLLQRTHVVGKAVYRPQRDTLSSLLVLDLEWQLSESLLQKADKMSMGASIELRTPILDIEVAKVAARIPSSLKLPPNGPGKFVLRKALERKLGIPGNNPKKGFPVPLHQWFAGPLQRQIEDELFAQNSHVTGLLDRSLLRAAWDRLLGGADLSRVFFSLWIYERWRMALSQKARLAA